MVALTDDLSGGEQQRVTLERGFVHPCPTLLPDEPAASLDPANLTDWLTPQPVRA